MISPRELFSHQRALTQCCTARLVAKLAVYHVHVLVVCAGPDLALVAQAVFKFGPD
jgi:hypothetical protein